MILVFMLICGNLTFPGFHVFHTIDHQSFAATAVIVKILRVTRSKQQLLTAGGVLKTKTSKTKT